MRTSLKKTRGRTKSQTQVLLVSVHAGFDLTLEIVAQRVAQPVSIVLKCTLQSVLVILVALVAAQAVDDAEQVISAFYRLSRVVCGSSLAGGATGL